jgi:hypothetical protein
VYSSNHDALNDQLLYFRDAVLFLSGNRVSHPRFWWLPFLRLIWMTGDAILFCSPWDVWYRATMADTISDMGNRVNVIFWMTLFSLCTLHLWRNSNWLRVIFVCLMAHLKDIRGTMNEIHTIFRLFSQEQTRDVLAQKKLQYFCFNAIESSLREIFSDQKGRENWIWMLPSTLSFRELKYLFNPLRSSRSKWFYWIFFWECSSPHSFNQLNYRRKRMMSRETWEMLA